MLTSAARIWSPPTRPATIGRMLRKSTGVSTRTRRATGLLASLSLVVSIQTNLLDTHPRFDVRSQLPATEVLRVGLVGDDVCC